MRIENWQIEMIVKMKMQGAPLEDISEKSGVPLEEVKKILKLK